MLHGYTNGGNKQRHGSFGKRNQNQTRKTTTQQSSPPGKNNKIKRIYPGAILKEYDPNMYAYLIFNIELLLSE